VLLWRSIIKSWKAFIYNNGIYSLSHLNEFFYEFLQPPKNGKGEQTYSFVVSFGLHCFTRGLNKRHNEQWNNVEQALIYSDSRERRVFDFKRYELSKYLPEIVRGVSGKSCFHTGEGNFFVVEIVDNNEEKQEYEVYFKVSKSEKLLRLFIESAYVRDSEHRSSQPAKKKISFFVIAYNILKNKPIKVSPK
jgi:hypothetical protein